MPKKKYSSGNPTAKSDFYVEFVPNNSGGVIIDIQSKTKVLHFSKLENSLIVLLFNASRTILLAKIVFTPTKLSLTLINSKVNLSFRFGLLDCEIHILLFSSSKPNMEPELGQ